MAEASGGFAELVAAAHGYDPFAWQQRLLGMVLATGRWPAVIDLPTGAGKTSVLDVAVFALAADPDRFPRRVVFVIDRRVVVDQVTRHALRLLDALSHPRTPGVADIASRLRSLSGGEDPLGVVALRGGIPLDGSWAHRPDQPWVIVSTVDQYGSRLLFRGYGTSKGMRPVHAGLAGNDCLVVLDEVHLSLPFAATLTRLTANPTPSPLPRRFQVVQMSATPHGPGDTPFRLGQQDLDPTANPEFVCRVTATKQARLRPVGKSKQAAHEVLPSAVEQAVASWPAAASTIGVVVNRVRTAREVHRLLSARGTKAELLTGRMRPLDRADLLDRVAGRLDPDRNPPEDQERLVVVATQAIEVGADITFDGLITETAPIDALRQRFGRLDRRGRFAERAGTPAEALILGVKDAIQSTKPDPVYGAALRAAWEELIARFGDRPFDVGPTSADLEDMPEATISPTPGAPLLLASHLDAWVQTDPEPTAQPAIDPFLHGWDTSADPDVTVVWRWDTSPAVLAVCPPRPAEGLPVPLHAAQAWLEGLPEPDVADVDAAATGPAGPDTGRTVLRWRGFRHGAEEVPIANIEPGNTLIVGPDRGGVTAGTWDPTGTERVEDLGDRAQLAYQRQVTLRLDPRVLPAGLVSAHPVPQPADEESTLTDLDAARQWLAASRDWLEGQTDAPDWLRKAVGRLLDGQPRVTAADGYLIVTGPYKPGRPTLEPTLLDGSDDTNSFTETAVTLRDHLDGVGRLARQFAERVGFPSAIAADLELAGRLHDLGKADPRFQLRLLGGDEVAHARLVEPLAKSTPGTPHRAAGYPAGMRHELLSVALTESEPSLIAGAADPDLVLHLIATHHGHSRPLPPIVTDPDPRTVTHKTDGVTLTARTDLTGTDLAIRSADRFWTLIQRYGHHGLAWLEAALRLADHRRSEQEAEP